MMDRRFALKTIGASLPVLAAGALPAMGHYPQMPGKPDGLIELKFDENCILTNFKEITDSPLLRKSGCKQCCLVWLNPSTPILNGNKSFSGKVILDWETWYGNGKPTDVTIEPHYDSIINQQQCLSRMVAITAPEEKNSWLPRMGRQVKDYGVYADSTTIRGYLPEEVIDIGLKQGSIVIKESLWGKEFVIIDKDKVTRIEQEKDLLRSLEDRKAELARVEQKLAELKNS